MKFPFFPGCALKTTANNYEVSALEATKIVDIELIELDKWNCCGTVHSLLTDDVMHQLAPVRALIKTQKMIEKGLLDDERLVTVCPECFSALKRADLFVKKYPEKLKTLNLAMERDEEEPYKKSVKVVHLLEILKEVGYDKIAEKVKKPLKNLKVIPYYGCLTLRPKEAGIDNPENPTILEDLLNALGAKVIENPYKLKCCGRYLTVNEKYVVAELTYTKLKYALSVGAEAIVVTCPLCAFNLDNRQKEVMEIHSDFKNIPVLYFTQLMAIAFGLNKKFFGFELNYVNPRSILKAV